MSVAHRVLARFLIRQSKTVWVVRDWDNRVEHIRDVCFPVDAEEEMPAWAVNPKVFPDETSAMADLERRLETHDADMLKQGLYRHMHSDGRIIYVSTPDTSR